MRHIRRPLGAKQPSDPRPLAITPDLDMNKQRASLLSRIEEARSNGKPESIARDKRSAPSVLPNAPTQGQTRKATIEDDSADELDSASHVVARVVYASSGLTSCFTPVVRKFGGARRSLTRG